ncbi:MAG: DUF6886 family protein [Planctomycetota bacterium]
MQLFHVSEESGIEVFEPRTGADGGEAVVWAVREDRLSNYLVPRDCPRVTYYAADRTTDADIARFLGSSRCVLAIESAWLSRVRQARLFCYRLPGETFACTDENAGYYQSRDAVTSIGVDVVDDCLDALTARGVEVRVLPSLWRLRDEVVDSTLGFSMIRMRNAQPRPVEPVGPSQRAGRGAPIG